MHFKRIEMHGFKSFADPVVVEFHNGITCVVGPNGSGKSNISDALRWVLGEQSPKTLRGGKMEEVIFAGTATRKSKGMAEVTLVINNADKSLNIDYAEVAITRKMYRSGESEYYINNAQCRLKDIRELIMDTGIAVDGYSIIGQGQISEIVSNKTESRREIFEEAAGIVKYRSKKAESERKLQGTHGNLERVNDIIGEIESRIDTVKEDSIKAKEFLQLREKQKAIEINITLKNIENIELKNEYLKDDIIEVKGSVDTYKDNRENIENDINQNRQRNMELDGLERETGDKLLTASNELGLMKGSSDVNEEKISNIDKDIERIEGEIQITQEKLDEEHLALEGWHDQKREVQYQLDTIKEELEQQSQAATGYFGKMNQFVKAAEDRKSSVYELYNQISTKKAEISSYENIGGTLERRKNQILMEKSQADDLTQGKRGTHEKLVKQTADSEKSLQALEAKMGDLSSKYATQVESEKTKSRQLQAVKIQKGEMAARKKAIEELEASYEGYNHAVRFIMKNASVIGGIHGVVADLIEVPKGYEVAIETSLGQAIQNIVCDTDGQAKKAVQLLKDHRAGRLTFLPVQSMKPSGFRDIDYILNAQGVLGIASDCVTFDPKFASVIQFLLCRTILVDGIDNAIALSKNAPTGARFVTLEGDVINPTGAITGGAHRQTTGNLLERKAEAKNLEEKLIELSGKELTLAEEIEELVEEIDGFQSQMSQLRQSHREDEIALTQFRHQRDQMATDMVAILESDAKWERELDNIRIEEQTASERSIKLREEIAIAESEVASIESQTDTGQKEYEEAKEAAEKYNDLVTETKMKIAGLESEKNNFDVLSKIIEDTITDLSTANEERKVLVGSLRAEKENLVNSVTANKEDVDAKQEQITDLEEKLRAYQEEKMLTMRYLNEIEGKRTELDKTIMNFQTQLHEYEMKLSNNETQVDGYKNRLWEEFEISYIHAMEFRSREFVMATAQKESREIKTRMKELGEINVGAIAEYETISERYKFLSEQKNDLLGAIKNLKDIIDDMDKTIRERFRESFEAIQSNFTGIFQELFGGGTAELKLENPNDIMESNIEIVAQPPGKRLQNINLLSGGEKTLTAIALMSAVLRSKPAPFVILDEVEAALDEANIVRFAKFLKSGFDGIQFTLVTHQKATMEFADVLYGVTMPEQGISKVLSLKLSDNLEKYVG